jgi:hypothetical protein
LRFCPFPFVDLAYSGSAPDFCFFVVSFQACGPPWGYDHPGRGCADGLQLLATGVGGVAGYLPRGLPGG